MAITLVVLAALLGVVALLLTREFVVPGLGQQVLARLSVASGVTLRAQNVRVHLLRGVILENLTFDAPRLAGTWKGTVPEARVEHALWPLLHREVRLTALTLTGPRLEFIGAPRGQGATTLVGVPSGSTDEAAMVAAAMPPPGAPPPSPTAPWIDFRVERVVVRKGTLTFRTAPDAPPLGVLQGIDLDMRGTMSPRAPVPLLGAESTGPLEVATIQSGSVAARDGRGQLRLGKGHLVLSPFRAVTEIGEVTIDPLDVDLTTSPLTVDAVLSGERLDLNALLGARDTGIGAARLTGTLRARGGAGSVTGTGLLSVADGQLPDIPLFRRLEPWVRYPIVGQKYRPLLAHFRVERSTIVIGPTQIDSDVGLLQVQGTTAFDGALDLRMTLRLPRARVRLGPVPASAIDALTDDQGLVTLPLIVTGRRDNPRVQPDFEGIGQQTGKSLMRGVENEIRRRLRGLFTPDRKPQ